MAPSKARAAYERLIAEWIAHGRQMPPDQRPAHTQRTGLTVNELFVAYWSYATEYYRKNGHPHQLRHNAATRLRNEFGIEAARVVLGHRSAGVTEIYAEIDHMRAADVMARVG